MTKQDTSTEAVLRSVRELGTLYEMPRLLRWKEPRPDTVPIESIATHSFMAGGVADFFWHMEANEYGVDLDRVKLLLQYHDLTEIGSQGDVLQYEKGAEQEVSTQSQREEVVGKLPLCMQDQVMGAIIEFDEEKTVDARFALACEKIEPWVLIYLMGIHRLVMPQVLKPGMESAWAPGACVRATRGFPIMGRYADVLKQEIETKLEEHIGRVSDQLSLFSQ